MTHQGERIELCGFQLLKPVQKGSGKIIYQAVNKEDGSEIFVGIIGPGGNELSENANCDGTSRYPVSHEVVISDAPCPANLNDDEDREFPVSIEGKTHWFYLKPGVRKPGFWSTTAVRVARKTMKKIGKNKLKILDMGCGCGIIGLVLGSSPEIDQVVFSDINADTLECTLANAKGRNLHNFELRTGDLFHAIGKGERFDLIIFGPPFYPSSIKMRHQVPDVGGPTGRELAKKYAESVSNYLTDVGFSITYIADYIGYRDILGILREAHLNTEVEDRHILYPYEPKFGFPQCNEIIWKNELESFCRYKFEDVLFNNRRFLSFKMIHLISSF